VQRTKDATIATNLGVPRSTARGWLREAPKIVVCLDVTDLKASELRQEVQASALLTYRQGTLFEPTLVAAPCQKPSQELCDPDNLDSRKAPEREQVGIARDNRL
jgi:hypothetical protein